MAAVDKFDVQVKMLLLGNNGVGKTCLSIRYADNTFSPTFTVGIGINFKIKTIDLVHKDESKRVKLQIWDAAGQERMKTVSTSYIRGVQVILLVYAVSDRGSFEHVEKWYRNIREFGNRAFPPIVALVANMTDLIGERVGSTCKRCT